MAVSNSNTHSLSLDELIVEAFDVIGVGSEGEAISADMYARARRSLNLMILSWNAVENLWRKENVSITLLDGTADYPLDPKPMRVLSARRKDSLSGYEVPMTEWARQEYLDQPNKTTAPSTPVNFYYDPQRDTGTMFVWPSPSAQVADRYTVEADVLRPMFLMDVSNNTLDLPQEWQETVVYNLAQRLKLKYPVNDESLGQRIDAMAAGLFSQLKGWDNEPVSMYLQPETRWCGR